MKKPADKKPARGIGAIKADVTPAVASDVRGLMKMVQHIAANNPEALKAAFGPYLTKRHENDPAGADAMAQFYADRAEYLAELFDYR